MTGRRPHTLVDAPRASVAGAPPRLLAVGDVPVPGFDPVGATPTDVSYLAFAEVSVAALERLAPDMVLSPLMGAGFDCLDLAEILREAGFKGQYRAVARQVPNPVLVRREIAERFPGLDFDLLVLDPDG